MGPPRAPRGNRGILRAKRQNPHKTRGAPSSPYQAQPLDVSNKGATVAPGTKRNRQLVSYSSSDVDRKVHRADLLSQVPNEPDLFDETYQEYDESWSDESDPFWDGYQGGNDESDPYNEEWYQPPSDYSPYYHPEEFHFDPYDPSFYEGYGDGYEIDPDDSPENFDWESDWEVNPPSWMLPVMGADDDGNMGDAEDNEETQKTA